MMLKLKQKTPPDQEPVSLEEIKQQLRIDLDDDSFDEQLSGLIVAAREWCEGYQNRAYITQTFELALDTWPRHRMIQLPRPTLQTVESLKYSDGGIVATWPAANYVVDTFAEPGYLVASDPWPKSKLPVVNGVVITYVAGYGDDPEDVPQTIKQAITLLVMHWFDNGICEPPPAVYSLLDLDRVVPI